MRTLSTFSLLLLGALLPAQDATDTILKIDGSSLRGVVVQSYTTAAVKFLRNKEEAELPAHQVADIAWGGVPDSFANGQAAMGRGDYEAARQAFGDAANAADRPVLKAEARLLQGKAAVQAAAGDPSAAANAAGALRAWIGEFPDHGRLPEANFLLGRALRLGKVYADATTTLKELDDRAGRDGWGSIWNARAKFELALCFMEDGKASEARTSFQSAGSAADTAMGSAGSAAGEMAAIKVNAKVGEGESLIAEKEYARATDFFRTLSQNEDRSLSAAGKAGLGESIFLAAADGKDAAALRNAEVALAEASVLDSGAADTAAKASYYLGCVVTALGERANQDWKNRATAYFQTVVKSYPSSRWVGPAKAALAK